MAGQHELQLNSYINRNVFKNIIEVLK